MLIGTNANGVQHGFAPAHIASSGVALCRFPLWRGFDYHDFIADLEAHHVAAVPVLDRRAFTEYEWRHRRFRRRLLYWRDRYPSLRYLQVANEPDQPNSESSSWMDQLGFWRLLKQARPLWPETQMIAGGLVHVDFSYLHFIPHGYIAAFHPYTQTPETIAALVDAIRQHWDGPLWCSELGIPLDFAGSVHEAAVWFSQMLEALWLLEIEAVIQFPWHAIMEPAFVPMIGADDVATEVYAAVRDASPFVSGRPQPEIIDVPGWGVAPFAGTPKGIVLHATRSGRDWSEQEEFDATLNYVRAGAGGLGWHATIGSGRLGLHVPPRNYTWHARGASRSYLGIEFAQPRYGDPITDHALDTAAWWIREYALKQWPDLPLHLVHHAELAEGVVDGKSDVYRNDDPEQWHFTERLLSRLR